MSHKYVFYYHNQILSMTKCWNR